MKIALIQDQLLTCAGSERVFLYMCQEFKEADIFTLCYNKETTLPEFKNFNIKVHPLFNKLIRSHKIFKIFFPISTYAMELWDFSKYDLIISSSATTAKYVKRFNGKHICYCYIPTRAIWNFDGYFTGVVGFKERVFKLFKNYFKNRDMKAASRVYKFLAISEITRVAINNCYKRDSEVLFAPIELPILDNTNIQKKDFYLIVSRLEKWKELEYPIKAFNKLNLPLKIIGIGPELSRLKNMANTNIEFLGGVDDNELSKYYSQALAVIFSPELEYGLVPIEAAAHGTPSIALGKGGVMETMINYDGKPTAIFYDHPDEKSLEDAVVSFQKISFETDILIKHAQSFSIPIFKNKFRNFVKSIQDDIKSSNMSS